jgi:hypothetical protein
MNDPESSGDKPSAPRKKRVHPIGTPSFTGDPADLGLPLPPREVLEKDGRDSPREDKPAAGTEPAESTTKPGAKIGEIPPEIKP